MHRSLFLVAAAIGFSTDADANEVGRYQLEPVRDGFVRLDTATGQISHCHREVMGWVCDETRDPGAAERRSGRRMDPPPRIGRPTPPPMRFELRRLQRDNERLREENEELREILEDDSARPAAPEARPGKRFSYDRPPTQPAPKRDEDKDEEIGAEPNDRGNYGGGIEGNDNEEGHNAGPEEREGKSFQEPNDNEGDCGEKRAESQNQSESDSASALIDRMMERFRDMIRELREEPKGRSL